MRACDAAPPEGVGQASQMPDGRAGEWDFKGRPARLKFQRVAAKPEPSDIGGAPPVIGLGPIDGAPGPPSMGAFRACQGPLFAVTYGPHDDQVMRPINHRITYSNPILFII